MQYSETFYENKISESSDMIHAVDCETVYEIIREIKRGPFPSFSQKMEANIFLKALVPIYQFPWYFIPKYITFVLTTIGYSEQINCVEINFFALWK